MNTINSLLNGIVLIALCVGAIIWFNTPHEYEVPNDAWFKSAVIERSEPVLVKFGADWCGPCRMLDPELDKLRAHTGGLLGVVKINVDHHQALAQHYGVSSIPRVFLFQNGKVVGDRTGYSDETQLQDWIASRIQP